MLLVKGREEDYIDLLQVRKIPIVKKKYLQPIAKDGDNINKSDEDFDAITLAAELRSIIKSDRSLHDLVFIYVLILSLFLNT